MEAAGTPHHGTTRYGSLGQRRQPGLSALRWSAPTQPFGHGRDSRGDPL